MTYLEPEIVPIWLKNGYLTCLEKGNWVAGTFLASHSYMLGELNWENYKFMNNDNVEIEKSNSIDDFYFVNPNKEKLS